MQFYAVYDRSLSDLKTSYKGILNILCFLYVDKIYTQDPFVENCINFFPSIQTLQCFLYAHYDLIELGTSITGL